MADISQIDKLRSGKAYQVFHKEYAERLDYTRELLAGEVDASQCLELKSRFHMLKGGAGFFGFGEIVRIAKELETLLGATAINALDDEGRRQLAESLQKLDECYREMPQPLCAKAEDSSRA